MHHKVEGISFFDPQQELEVQCWMDGFVDDTTAWFNRFFG